MNELIIDVPADEWISQNARLHWARKARMTKALRSRAFVLARSQKLQVPTPVLVVAEIGYTKGGRADPDNASPTVKACIDGIVSAGALPDDDSTHIVAITYQRGPKTDQKGVHRVHLKFIEQHVKF